MSIIVDKYYFIHFRGCQSTTPSIQRDARDRSEGALVAGTPKTALAIASTDVAKCFAAPTTMLVRRRLYLLLSTGILL